MTDRRRGTLLLWGPFLLLVARFAAFTPDDVFIPLRYGWNLLHGNGLVFNVDERVEGFTSPVQVVIATVAAALPADRAALVLKICSFAFACATLISARALIDECELGRRGTDLALFMVGSGWWLGYHAANGMETSLAAWLLTLLALLLVRGSSRQGTIALVAVAAVLARPESLLAIGMMFLVGLVAQPRELIGPRSRWFAGLVIAVCAVTSLRWTYYGDVVPNTFHAKRMATSDAVQAGAHSLWSAIQPGVESGRTVERLVSTGFVLLAVAAFAAGAVGWARQRSPRSVIAAGSFGQVLFAVSVGGDWMRGGRFLAPAGVLIVVTQVHGVLCTARFVGSRRPSAVRLTASVGACGLILGALLAVRVSDPMPLWRIGWSADDRALSDAGGDDDSWARAPELFRCARPGELVAFSEMGFGPWVRTDLRFLDTRGLTDRVVATTSERSARRQWGVDDSDWSDVTSATVVEVLRRRPVLVATHAPDPPESFGSASTMYVRVSSPVEGTTLYRRADVRCDDRGRRRR